MSEPASTFLGRPSKTERRFEAHLFLTCDDNALETVMASARRRRFRRSSRVKTSPSGANDVLLTRNSDDDVMLTEQLRQLAEDLARAGIGVYRIRLEEMVFDEVRVRPRT